MPTQPTYPGVYIEEIPSGVRTIIGVATSITAFAGRAQRGPTDTAEVVNSFGDFERVFGGLWAESTLGFAVRDFFLNGGSQAIIVRLYHAPFASEAEKTAATDAAKEVAKAATDATDVAGAKTAAAAKNTAIQGDATKPAAAKTAAKAVNDAVAAFPAGGPKTDLDAAANQAASDAIPNEAAIFEIGDVKLRAASPGKWAANLRVSVDVADIPAASSDLFNLTVIDSTPGGSQERHLNLSLDATKSRRADKALESESRLVRWNGDLPATPATPAAIREKQAAFATAAKAAAEAPNDTAKAAARDAAQDAMWEATLDALTIKERAARRATTKRQAAENAGADATVVDPLKQAEKAAATALDTARSKTAGAISDGGALTINDFLPPQGETNKAGLFRLEKTDLFNLLCIPPYLASGDVDANLLDAAAAYCERRRAMLLVDPPTSWVDKTAAVNDFRSDSGKVSVRSRNAAIFFPRVRQQNPLRDNRLETSAPTGAVAGVFARTDAERGVWKAPAGLDATLKGVAELSVSLTDAENGELNPLGVNCLRVFPVFGRVVWGSRTLRGADQLADEYKYVPVRRTALFLEESLYRGLKWVVFEPNDEPLWAQIRLNVGAFMQSLFRQGAFQGRTPREAYLVKCDRETTTQDDINRGIVNIVVGFAPLKPAEFVIIKIQQLAGQIDT